MLLDVNGLALDRRDATPHCLKVGVGEHIPRPGDSFYQARRLPRACRSTIGGEHVIVLEFSLSAQRSTFSATSRRKIELTCADTRCLSTPRARL